MATSIQRLIMIVLSLTIVFGILHGFLSSEQNQVDLFEEVSYTDTSQANMLELLEQWDTAGLDSNSYTLDKPFGDQRAGGAFAVSTLTDEGANARQEIISLSKYAEDDWELAITKYILWALGIALTTLIGIELFFILYAKKNT